MSFTRAVFSLSKRYVIKIEEKIEKFKLMRRAADVFQV